MSPARVHRLAQPLGDDHALVASVNGPRRCAIYLTTLAEPDRPLRADTIDLANLTSRRRFTEALPEGLQALAEPVLLRLAAEADLVRARDGSVPDSDSNESVTKAEEPWEDPVIGHDVLSDVHKTIKDYTVVSSAASLAIALWVPHTFVTHVTGDFTPYLHVSSPVRECGKSTLLELLRWLAYRAQLTGGYTAAALYRRIDRDAPTLLLDELDTRLRGDGGEALRGVLNTGFQRSGKMTTCVGDNHEPTDFSTFCPKVLAGIGRLWDTVASRSIPIRMARASKEEIRALRRMRGDRIGDELLPLRRRLLRWAEDSRDVLADQDPMVPEVLGARESDIWRPLLTIADCVGGDWPEKARSAAIELHTARDDEGDFGLLLLQDVCDLLGDKDAILTETLQKGLASRDDRPWSEYGRGERPITPRGIASLLGRFGVKPGTVRIGDSTGKGYARQKLAPAFHRYLPPAPPRQSVTSVTTPDSPSVGRVTDRVTGDGSDGVIRHNNGDSELTAERVDALLNERRARRSTENTIAANAPRDAIGGLFT